MPMAIKDINHRFYSPDKYFTISVDREKPKINISKSFDQFHDMKTNKSRERKPFYTKLNSNAVNRMKQFINEKKSVESNEYAENVEEAFKHTTSKPHKNLKCTLPSVAVKKKSVALVKYKSLKTLLIQELRKNISK